MRPALGWLLASAVALAGCPGPRARPVGPAPEYERPVLPPWDGGAGKDPLDSVEGEPVPDDEPGDAGPSSAPDAAGSDGGVAPELARAALVLPWSGLTGAVRTRRYGS